MNIKSLAFGIVSSLLLLFIYFGLITLISDWDFALNQFNEFWMFVVSLAIGFGIQIGLYTHLRDLVNHPNGSRKVLAVSGVTSAGAMVSCCTHYLVNILPVIGVTGFVSIVAQYQTELFWFGLLSNAVGIAYIARKIFVFSRLR